MFSVLKRSLHLPSNLTKFYTDLERGLVSVKGQDCAKFLHGLSTSNVNKLFSTPPPAQFSSFLSHNGRVLFDMFLWNPNENSPSLDDRQVLIECQRPYVLDIMLHLHSYKARSRVDIQDVTEEWRAVAAEETVEDFNSRRDKFNILGIRDQRSPNWSISRYLLSKSQFEKDKIFSDLQKCSREEYRLQRMIHGVPEGFVEIKSGHAIPFDFNLDTMGAVEQNKGCYTGQELITRTLHQGLIRKRLYPIRLYNPDTENIDSEFTVDPNREMHVITETEMMGATVNGNVGNIVDYTANYNVKMGRIVRTIGNVGMAIIRQEHLDTSNRNFAAVINDRPSMILCEIITNEK